MAEQSIEAKSKAIAAKRNEPGEEFKDYQSAANQLLEIQAAQKENLNMARLENAADASQNELLAQSAALMAANNTSQAGGAQLNPATQTILNKYGLNAPKVIKQTERVVTPQKINITNNNITNNNVSVPANIGGPLQGRPLQFSQPKDNTGNFKNWISNVFARQEANAVKRQAEYDKKDRSLTRSANRIMRKLEDMTKTISSNLDPRKIGSTWQSQLKTLGLLFGLHLLTKNWEKVLKRVEDIGNWFQNTLDYFGIVRKDKNEEGQCRFVKDAVKFLGGEEGETVGQALIKLFGKDGIAGLIMAKMTQLFGDFSDRVKLFFEERGAAVKQVKFPDLKPGSGVIEVIKGLGVYLADILACLTGGTAAAKQSAINNIYNTGALDSEKGYGWKTNYNKFSDNTHSWVKDKDGKTLRNTSWGDASIAGTKIQRGQNTLDSFDIVDNGKGLFNNTSSSIKQSRAITSMAGDLESGKVHTGAIMTGMERLKSSINQNGYTLVDPDFVKTLGNKLGIEGLKNLDLENAVEDYKFVQVEKTDEDYAREGANIGEAALKGGIEGYALQKGKELSGANWMMTNAATNEIIQDPGNKALWEGFKAATKRLFAENNKLILVPADDPRPAVKIDGKDTFKYLKLNAKSIKAIEEAIGKALNVTDEKGNSTFTFDVTDKASREAFNTSLTNTIKAGMRDRESIMVAAQQGINDPDAWGKIADYRSRMANVREDNTDLSENIEALQHLSEVEQSQAAVQERYNQRREERREEYESTIKGNRTIQVEKNIETDATNAYNSVRDKVAARTKTPTNFKNKEDYVTKMVPFFENKVKEKKLASEENAREYAYWLTAQSGIESTWGRSGLSTDYNNYSGISANYGKGLRNTIGEYGEIRENCGFGGRDAVKLDNKKRTDPHWYTIFSDIEDWADYYLNLLNNSRYKAFTGDPDKYMDRVKGGGYATDPNYISTITNTKKDVVDIFSKVKPEELEYAEIREPIIPEPVQKPEERKEEGEFDKESRVEYVYNEQPTPLVNLPEITITAEKPKLINPVDIAIANNRKNTAVPGVNTENITSGEINPLSPLNKENVTSVRDLLASIKNGIDYGNKINELGVSATSQVVDSNAQIVQAIIATEGKQNGKQVYTSREYSESPNPDNIV